MDFSATIWQFYEKNKRSFPWRETTDPYAILVSEIMLQQTQTYRVLPKYLGWLKLFPTIQSLASATLLEVLKAWSGLGYNRRAKFLLEAAKVISTLPTFPLTYEELVKLPGIGEYTANAVLAFAAHQKTVVLETNIRTAIIHHFFEHSESVTDKDIKFVLKELVEKQSDPQHWYYALMDYGNWLKSEGIDYFHKQKHHVKQKAFKGSERFVRGWIIRHLTANKVLNSNDLEIPGYTREQITKIISNLEEERLVVCNGNIVSIPK